MDAKPNNPVGRGPLRFSGRYWRAFSAFAREFYSVYERVWAPVHPMVGGRSLQKGEILLLHCQPQKMTLRVVEGTLWITTTRGEDIVLKEGETWQFEGESECVLEALASSRAETVVSDR